MSGLSIIGQLVTQLVSRIAPAQLRVADSIDNRRILARSYGVTHVIDPSTTNLAEAVRDLTGGRGADIVIEVSGAARALNEAIRTVGYNGLVVAMSWYGGSLESLDLSGEFHHNRPRIVSCQVGTVNPCLGPLWNIGRRTQMVKQYLQELNFQGLISYRLPLDNAPEAYKLLDQHPEVAMQILFRYQEDT